MKKIVLYLLIFLSISISSQDRDITVNQSLYLPTAETLKRGEKRINIDEFIVNSFSWGITNNIQFTYTAPLFIPTVSYLDFKIKVISTKYFKLSVNPGFISTFIDFSIMPTFSLYGDIIFSKDLTLTLRFMTGKLITNTDQYRSYWNDDDDDSGKVDSKYYPYLYLIGGTFIFDNWFMIGAFTIGKYNEYLDGDNGEIRDVGPIIYELGFKAVFDNWYLDIGVFLGQDYVIPILNFSINL